MITCILHNIHFKYNKKGDHDETVYKINLDVFYVNPIGGCLDWELFHDEYEDTSYPSR